MPDFSQAARGLEPATVVDHVLLPVGDLEEAAHKVEDRYGLQVLPGGRHPNIGTANMIVPLGLQYLELITVADPAEAAEFGLGQAVTRCVAEGKTFVAWALRTPDLDALRTKLERAGWSLPPMWEGSRPLAGGRTLRWRTQDLVPRGQATALPFAIQWDVPEDLHPGRAVASHRVGAASLRKVVVGARDDVQAREQLHLLLGDGDLYEVQEAAEDGVCRLILATPGGEVVID